MKKLKLRLVKVGFFFFFFNTKLSDVRVVIMLFTVDKVKASWFFCFSCLMGSCVLIRALVSAFEIKLLSK